MTYCGERKRLVMPFHMENGNEFKINCIIQEDLLSEKLKRREYV